METIQTVYSGSLRTEALHIKSGQRIITDAPTDNHGRGEAFSPTDLLCASLGSCMLTLMGIAANGHNLNIDNTKIKITKVMAANPRRVSEVLIDFFFEKDIFSDKEKKILETAALTCPVAYSLHPDIKQVVNFYYHP